MKYSRISRKSDSCTRGNAKLQCSTCQCYYYEDVEHVCKVIEEIITPEIEVVKMTTAERIIEATVELINEDRDIIRKNGKYGAHWYVRSLRATDRFYVVSFLDSTKKFTCSCGAGSNDHEHIDRILASLSMPKRFKPAAKKTAKKVTVKRERATAGYENKGFSLMR